jgi:hypothetical protein
MSMLNEYLDRPPAGWFALGRDAKRKAQVGLGSTPSLSLRTTPGAAEHIEPLPGRAMPAWGQNQR